MKNKNIKKKSISNISLLMVVAIVVAALFTLMAVTSSYWMGHDSDVVRSFANKSEVDGALDSFLGTTGESSKALKWGINAAIIVATIIGAVVTIFKIVGSAHKLGDEDAGVRAEAKKSLIWACVGLGIILMAGVIVGVVINVVGSHTGFQKAAADAGTGSSGANPSLIIEAISNSFVLK